MISNAAYKKEIRRKLFHLSSLWMPLAIYFMPKAVAIEFFGVLVIIALLFEILRRGKGKMAAAIHYLFKNLLREHESAAGWKLSGATYMLIGAFACLFFSTEIAVTALAVLVISDTAASLVGMKFGRTRLLGKSLEGCAAFALSGLITVIALGILMPTTTHYLAAGSVAVIVATGAELCSKKIGIDDNLAVSLTMAAIMWFFQLIFYY